MGKRLLKDVSYIPLLTLRPAEMQALEELPEHDKNLMMPFFHLGPWSTAHRLASSLERLELAYEDRSCFVTICEPDGSIVAPRPVHQELALLRNPERGYEAWCNFIESNINFVPAVQLAASDQLQRQVTRLYSLGRGLMVSIDAAGFPAAEQVAKIISSLADGGRDVCFLLDLGRINDAIFMEGQASVYALAILGAAPNAFVAISASSFPASFTTTPAQEIKERIGFNNVAAKIGARLIYSDRGSARAEQLPGGGGPLFPRIDYPLKNQWSFFRSENGVDKKDVDLRKEVYFVQARAAMASSSWESKLRIWGTQMIERTALGDNSAITNPMRSTAARINIHLHRQLFYDDPGAMYDTDDEWSD